MPLEMISARDVQLAIKSRCRGRKKDDYLCAVLDILRELHGDPRLQWTDPRVDEFVITHVEALWYEIYALRVLARCQDNSRVKTYCSRKLGALRAIGVKIGNGRREPKLCTDWQAIVDTIADDHDKWIACALAYWATARGLRPADMTSALVKAFADGRMNSHADKSTIQAVRRLAAIWDVLAEHHSLAAVENPFPHANIDVVKCSIRALDPTFMVQLTTAAQELAALKAA